MTTLETDQELVNRRDPDHHVTVEPCAKWVRVMVNGRYLADSRRTLLLFETRHVPVYYFPKDDVRMDLMSPSDHATQCPYKGTASYWTINDGGRGEENAVWGYPEPLPDCPDLSNYVAFYWSMVDHWFEENEEVYVHARDPYKRVDVIASTRHVEVVLDGETVADTHNPWLLFETGLPVRYYIPITDVRLDLLEPSDRVTRCPYKGEASYYSVKTSEHGKDIIWCYRYPTMESGNIAGHLCFFDERVEALYVDGELQKKPVTRWSNPI